MKVLSRHHSKGGAAVAAEGAGMGGGKRRLRLIEQGNGPRRGTRLTLQSAAVALGVAVALLVMHGGGVVWPAIRVFAVVVIAATGCGPYARRWAGVDRPRGFACRLCRYGGWRGDRRTARHRRGPQPAYGGGPRHSGSGPRAACERHTATCADAAGLVASPRHPRRPGSPAAASAAHGGRGGDQRVAGCARDPHPRRRRPHLPGRGSHDRRRRAPRAWYVPSGNGAALLLLPGSGSNRTSTLGHAAVLAKHGYGVLLLDTRGHGKSDGHAMDFGWYGDIDIEAAVAYLGTRPDVRGGRIGVVGLSMPKTSGASSITEVWICS